MAEKAEKEVLGYADCPYCAAEVSIKSSKKGKPYYTCTKCGHQTFFRQERSVELLRAKARPDKKTMEVKGDDVVQKADDVGNGEEQPGSIGWWKW